MKNVIFSVFPNENFVDLCLYQFGWEQCEPAHSYGPAMRNHYLFHYIVSGTGILYADDKNGQTKTYQVKSGQGFVIFPNQITTYIADKDYPWEYVWLEFDGLRVKETMDICGFSKDAPLYRAKYKDICETMKQEMLYIANHRDASPLHLIGHLYLFLDAFTRSRGAMNALKENSLQNTYIREAITFIEQNFQNDISIEEIARVCGINRSYFGKIFKERMGTSPQEFLLHYRMSKAAELLKLTELSVGDIGKAVSYENQLHFSRAFKNVYQVSPREWRKQNKVQSYPSEKE